MAHQMPFDILVTFAQAGDDKLALNLALTCRMMKRLIDERYENKNMVCSLKHRSYVSF